MSPDFDFWERDDAGSKDYNFNQKKSCVHRKIVSLSTLRISEFVCDHPSKKGKICDETECTLEEAI